jgi:CheY-like chemotaxis protein
MTAFGLPGDEERILRAGFNLYARKPVEPLHLATLVAQVRAPRQ